MKIMQVVPSDTKNDLLIDLLETNIMRQVENSILMLAPGTGELSQYCKSRSISFEVVKKNRTIFRQIIATYRFVRKIKPDRIFFQSFFPSFIGSVLTLIPSMNRTRVIAVRHHNRNHHLLRNRKAALVDKFISKRVEYVFAVSNTVKKTLQSEGCDPTKIIVVENGLNFSRYGFIYPTSRNYDGVSTLNLLAVGRLDWQKNYDLMFEVISQLRLRGVDVTLTIYGAGADAERTRLNKLGERLGIESSILWRGWIPNIEYAYDNSHIFIHTAADEACPLVLIEAQLSGIPLVSTSNGGSVDVLGEHYGLVKTNIANDLCLRILKIASSYQSYLTTSNLGIRAAQERFNPEKMASHYTNLSVENRCTNPN